MGKKFTLEYVEQCFLERGCELLEKEYKNSATKLRYKCECGEKSKIRFNDFQQGQRCMHCSGNKKHTYKEVYNYFKKQKCELLETEYKNNIIPMKYRCSCGNISKIIFKNFKKGQRCRKCSGSEKHTYKYIYNYFKENGCILLEKEYKNAKILMTYVCSCKNISKISFNSFQQGRRCKKCGVKKRYGEKNGNFNHSLTDEERKLKRFYPEYREWRKNVYTKDNYVCQKCFQRGGKINAHHIENYSSNKKLRLKISNGITLCSCCHKEYHSEYGKKNNNRCQLKEFLSTGIYA